MNKGEVFVLSIITIVMIAGIIKMAIRAKHGYPLESRQSRRNARRGIVDSNDFGGTGLDADRKVELLSSENEKLISQIGRLEERLRVLERIATDPAERVSREIEDLRTRD